MTVSAKAGLAIPLGRLASWRRRSAAIFSSSAVQMGFARSMVIAGATAAAAVGASLGADIAGTELALRTAIRFSCKTRIFSCTSTNSF